MCIICRAYLIFPHSNPNNSYLVKSTNCEASVYATLFSLLIFLPSQFQTFSSRSLLKHHAQPTPLLCQTQSHAYKSVGKVTVSNILKCTYLCKIRENTVLNWLSGTNIPRLFLIRIVWGGVHTGSTLPVGHWMAYCTCPGWLWWWRIWWNDDW
jgi:hypothetical protein